ncbi:hypothetical protein BC351_07145 [Paenibacillus ferrarius]|uniref:Uncharacterized protein n=1 Tax=Paenibacillus ferrarius TaxID=1469647 RepID=A0A1V4HCG9_9BACL|nr:hypothetical protein BC351_07145 [Paenibacillus ferrarius]
MAGSACFGGEAAFLRALRQPPFLAFVELFGRSINPVIKFLVFCAVYIKFKGGIVEKGGAIMALPI